MGIYATVSDVQARMTRCMDGREQSLCAVLLEDAAVLIDGCNANADADAKKVVSCRMVVRALGDGNGGSGVPIGATQASMSALGYQQQWTITGGSSGELYLSKLEKNLLGAGNRVGSYSPVQELAPPPPVPPTEGWT